MAALSLAKGLLSHYYPHSLFVGHIISTIISPLRLFALGRYERGNGVNNAQPIEEFLLGSIFPPITRLENEAMKQHSLFGWLVGGKK